VLGPRSSYVAKAQERQRLGSAGETRDIGLIEKESKVEAFGTLEIFQASEGSVKAQEEDHNCHWIDTRRGYLDHQIHV
jgi:hypothetical protein